MFFIGILDFDITQNPHYLSRHRISDIETGENVISDIEFNFIELPKFNKQEAELKSIIDQWVYFIKNAESLEVTPNSVKDKGLKTAYEIANKHSWTKKELEIYDYILMREEGERNRWIRATRIELEKAGKEFDKERKTLEKEKEKAEKQKEKAEKELIKEREKTVLILLQAGFSVEDVQKHTQLSVEEIKKIKI